MSYINEYKFTAEANAAYEKGYNDGTITDSLSDVKNIVLDQEVVSYSSEVGTYTFDYLDFEHFDELR